MGWKAATLEVARRAGVLPAIGAVFGRRRLTALAFHRIADVSDPDLPGFVGNVSATPEDFAAHLDFLVRHFQVVGIDDLLACLDGGDDLPERAALVTFDDGYRDNLEVAAPLLAERGLPATLFLTTGPTDGGPSLYWDLAAWVVEHGRRCFGDLPALGRRDWSEPAERRRIIHEFVYATKRLSPDRREAALAALRVAVDAPDGDRIPNLYLDWDGVRALRGWTIGAHTVTHPVLTAITPGQAAAEIAGSADRIRAETGQPVRALAYPNGLAGDWNAAVADAARTAGISWAFTLLPGPARRSEVYADPLAVRRVYVSHGDRPAVVAAKAMGAARLMGAAG